MPLLLFVLCQACLEREMTSTSGKVLLTVHCKHREEAAIHLPEDARDWRETRDILVEFIPQFAMSRPPRQVQVTFSSNGLQPRRVAVTTQDSLQLINASHRPLVLRSLGPMQVQLYLKHGDVKDVTLDLLKGREEIFDDSHSRVLTVVATEAPIAGYANSHTPIHFMGLRKGPWILRLSHDRIPALDIPFEFPEKGILELSPALSVGRLPLIR
jgi:hypothetical protein